MAASCWLHSAGTARQAVATALLEGG